METPELHVPASTLTQTELDRHWDFLEEKMGPMEDYCGFGRQSTFLHAAYRNRLISWGLALELYEVAIGRKIVLEP